MFSIPMTDAIDKIGDKDTDDASNKDDDEGKASAFQRFLDLFPSFGGDDEDVAGKSTIGSLDKKRIDEAPRTQHQIKRKQNRSKQSS